MVTVSRTIDGLEVSATPHMAFPEGNRIAAALLEVLAPVVVIDRDTIERSNATDTAELLCPHSMGLSLLALPK